MLNYRKLASCPFIDKHIPFMKSGSVRNGAAFVPTRHITQNLTLIGKSKSDKTYKFNEAQRNEPCPFMDPIHPTVECYGAIAQSLAYTLQDVIRNETNFQTLEPLPSRVTLAESGVVQFGGSFVKRPASGDEDAAPLDSGKNVRWKAPGLRSGSDDDVADVFNNAVKTYLLWLVMVVAVVSGALLFHRKRLRVVRNLSTRVLPS
jgi:hypothetical protein